MAIDDNTLYGLTGAQLKELPGKVDAVKGEAKELTEADYNWPETGTKTSVALWKLKKPGLYKWATSFSKNVLLASSTYANSIPTQLVFVYANPRFSDYTNMVIFGDASVGNAVRWLSVSTAGGSKWKEVTFQPTDSLTSTSDYIPLAASQGKILKDFIGDLTNLTTTDKTNLVAAINEAAAGGGGGMTELTTADYDYPTNNPDGIALWNLPVGWYVVPKSSNPLKVYMSVGSSEDAYAGLFSISQMQGKVFIGKWINDLGDFRAAFRRTDVDGTPLDSSWNSYYLLGNTSIVNNLTTDSSAKVLSAAQGKVLKDSIGDLTNLTTTDKTNLVAAINEAAAGGGGGITVVQTTGTSTTDVMSQNAVTSMVFADPATQQKIKIGAGASSSAGVDAIEIGYNAAASGYNGVSMGYNAKAAGARGVAIGASTYVQSAGGNGVAIGAGARANQQGQFDISCLELTGIGYNNSNYRLLTGLYDPQSAHDAATKGYVDTAVAGAGASAFTTNEWNALWA